MSAHVGSSAPIAEGTHWVDQLISVILNRCSETKRHCEGPVDRTRRGMICLLVAVLTIIADHHWMTGHLRQVTV